MGARGLTGGGYAGHVFWDADVFVLPALATVDPPAAAAMVRYRLHRLRRRARPGPREGPRRAPASPGSPARDGHDVTPARAGSAASGVAIRTGPLEEHVTADVAWAAVHHATWTRPDGGPDRPGSAAAGRDRAPTGPRA